MGSAARPAIAPAVENASYRIAAGMGCASCVGHVERALRPVPGVLDAAVNPATGRATVTTVSTVEEETLVRAIASAGYRKRPACHTT